MGRRGLQSSISGLKDTDVLHSTSVQSCAFTFQFSVPILSSVTDTLLFLNDQKMTSFIRRDGFV